MWFISWRVEIGCSLCQRNEHCQRKRVSVFPFFSFSFVQAHHAALLSGLPHIRFREALLPSFAERPVPLAFGLGPLSTSVRAYHWTIRSLCPLSLFLLSPFFSPSSIHFLALLLFLPDWFSFVRWDICRIPFDSARHLLRAAIDAAADEKNDPDSTQLSKKNGHKTTTKRKQEEKAGNEFCEPIVGRCVWGAAGAEGEPKIEGGGRGEREHEVYERPWEEQRSKHKEEQDNRYLLIAAVGAVALKRDLTEVHPKERKMKTKEEGEEQDEQRLHEEEEV